ncbi:hypothetical protein FS847_13175 [Streptomyces sp. ISID311]|nr:hypothetical protein FS847_13175 [Streptomyces sp. ISID311]
MRSTARIPARAVCSRGDLTRRPLRRLARHGLPAAAALITEGQIGSHRGAHRGTSCRCGRRTACPAGADPALRWGCGLTAPGPASVGARLGQGWRGPIAALPVA